MTPRVLSALMGVEVENVELNDVILFRTILGKGATNSTSRRRGYSGSLGHRILSKWNLFQNRFAGMPAKVVAGERFHGMRRCVLKFWDGSQINQLSIFSTIIFPAAELPKVTVLFSFEESLTESAWG